MNIDEKINSGNVLSPESRLDSSSTVSADSRAKKALRTVLLAALALIAILVITLPNYVAGKDYISYWSAGQLLLHHADPYSPSGLFALQKAHGSREAVPNIMRNPPWALFLVLPLGFVGPLTGLFFWILADVACVFASIRLLNVPQKNRAFAFVFAPFIACVLCGQSSVFLLLGFSLFLRLHKTNPSLAGASLLLMAIKPHLFVIFWAVLLVDCICRRRLRVLAGGTVALAVASAFPLLFDAHVWQHYFAMMHSATLGIEVFPTASMHLRLLIDPKAVWLLFVPTSLAILWALWYYVRSREVWDWNIQGMLLMLVAVLCSPYGWFSDETVLLPSIFFGLASPRLRRNSSWVLMVANTLALCVVFSHASLTSRAYLWTPFAWLAWFLYSTAKSRLDHVPFRPVEARVEPL